MALSVAAISQAPACKPAATHGSTPAEDAYAQGDYAQAETLYMQALSENQDDERLGASLVQTFLREGKIAEAANRATRLSAAHPGSAVLLTALAEVQLRQGEPWQSKKTLERSAAIDPCLARTHLIRSKVDRVDSMYSSERSEIQAAYAIEPTDVEIARAWRQSVSIANDAVSIDKAIAGSDLDTTGKQQAQVTLKSMLSNLSENSQTCQITPATQSAVLPLLPSIRDGKHIDAYKLEVKLPQTKAVLQVDTAASGLYISRTLADLNGLHQAQDGVPGTVYAANVTIGPLEFRECTLGVSDTPFYEKADGYIGTDVFSSYLIKLDQPNQKLELSPLPLVAGTVLPGDRTQAAELREFTPVYHRRQYLLLPVTLNGKERKLFVLDSGLRYTTMPSEVAHAISTTRMNFTNAEKTTSGATINVYRDGFDLEFADLLLRNRSHLLEMEAATTEASVGMKLGGMLGFDMLHSMTMQLDYRDGLIKLETTDHGVEVASGGGKAGTKQRVVAEVECPPDDTTDHPFSTLIAAEPSGLWDSGNLKVGESLSAKLVQEWTTPGCRLDQGANLYGRVVKVVPSKHRGSAELALVFDQGDCAGHNRQSLTLNVIGLVAPDDDRQALHNAIPIEVTGGTRQIREAVSALENGTDFDLNPGGAPGTVHPGVVMRMPGVQLGLHAGPHCSVLLRNSERDVRVGTKTQILLTMGTPH